MFPLHLTSKPVEAQLRSMHSGQRWWGETRLRTRGERQEIGKDREKANEKKLTHRGKMTQGIGEAVTGSRQECMSDSFTNDLWMIYPWTCLCLSEHQRPFKSGDAVSGDRVEPWLISHYLKVDPQDRGDGSLPPLPKPSCLLCMQTFLWRAVIQSERSPLISP